MFPIQLSPVFNDKVTIEINDFMELCRYVQKLPYGRNADRSRPELVLLEGKGTCSSKHAFLKKIADENNHSEVKLILAIFKMNAQNTPGIGDALNDSALDFMPEAHCYLKFDNQRLDFTNPESDFLKIADDILLEKEIQPSDVNEFKVTFHQQFLKKWIFENEIDYSFNEIWALRERCISNLSNN